MNNVCPVQPCENCKRTYDATKGFILVMMSTLDHDLYYYPVCSGLCMMKTLTHSSKRKMWLLRAMPVEEEK